MKKNSISAFKSKQTKLKKITGGGYFEGTYRNGTRCDSQYVTEKGEWNGFNEAQYDQYDADVCNY